MLWNFIRSETYRATRLKCFYILPVIMLAATFLVGMIVMRMDLAGMLGYTQQDLQELGELGNSVEGYQRSFEVGFNTGLDMSRNTIENGGSPELKMFGIGLCYYEDVPEIFHQNISSLDQLILVAVFAGMFMGEIFTTGNDRNLLISTKHRGLLLAARYIVFAGYMLILHVLRFFFSAFSVLCLGESVKWNIDRSFIMYFIITYFLTVAFGYVLCALAYVTRSKAATVAVGVSLALGVLSMAISLVNYIVNRNFNTHFDLARYTLSQNLTTLGLQSDGDFVLKTVVVGVVYFVAAIAVGAVTAKNRDIG